jgi:hypothetical protein
MVLSIDMLPAGHGDAFVVEYGVGATRHQILIDAGTYHTWDGVRAELVKRRKDRYETFVVTHVDEDHIGGAIALLDDPDLKHRVSDVWFNGYVHCKRGGNVLGPVNGEQLTSRIAEGGFRWNHGFPRRVSNDVGGPLVVPSAGPLPRIELPGGARIVLLSPTGPKLRRMADVWEEAVRKAHLVAGAGSEDHTTSPKPFERVVDALPDPLDAAAVARLAAQSSTDGSEANGSSIAFVLEHGDAPTERILLAGDAHASVLTKNLKRYADEVGEQPVRIDLVKLSHHGSNANVSAKMLGLIDCRRYLVSTNGDNFGHPNDAAIAKVVAAAGGPVTFYCNYRSARTDPWAEHGPGVGATFEFPKGTKRTMRVSV